MTDHVDLYWLPLGVGDSGCVRWNGRAFEAFAAHRDSRKALDLYHSALEVTVGADRFVIEMGPAWGPGSVSCAMAEGSVGSPVLGRSRLFRYQVRQTRNGTVPNLASAVDSPDQVSADAFRARRLLALVPEFPTGTWGRDELGTGDMWNSNSLVSWLLASSGHDVTLIDLPHGGRAPGWQAGVSVAQRETPLR